MLAVTRHALLCLALVAPVAREAPARAQTPDVNEAKALFDDGRKLMKAGQYDLACPKLEEARAAYPGPGVLLNLGDCYEKAGRKASAWRTFGDAIARASAAGRADYEAEAQRRQRALEPALSRLAIRVAKSPTGLVVTRDGATVERDAWGVAVPVDAGTHVVEARAGGRLAWSASIRIAAPGETVTVDLPEIADARAPAPQVEGARHDAAPPRASNAPKADHDPLSPHWGVQAAAAPPWGTRRVAGATMGGLGVMSLGVSTVLLVLAEQEFAAAEGETDTRRSRDAHDAVVRGNVASVGFAVGTAMVAGGLTLWLVAPGKQVAVAATGRGFFLEGRF